MAKRLILYVCLVLVTAQHAMTQENLDFNFLDDLDPEYDDLDPCDPSCLGELPGALVPDPWNCHRYHTCLEDGLPSDVLFTCPDGGKFDVFTSKCSPDFGNVTCGTCEANCMFDCPSDDITFVSSRYNCSQYLLCGMGEQDPLECPSEAPYYDGEECQTDPDLCCDPCQVFCFSAFTEIADPQDCNRFYYCAEDNYFPGDEDVYECPDGGVFYGGECVEDDGAVECDEPCA